uniref:Mitochondrial carrier n=1 Tax=Mycena chlorophos TaxID=658473 RepID=A0ABQ0L271_MYCCL|nr:predicted protein [Mycena chlorophos]
MGFVLIAFTALLAVSAVILPTILVLGITMPFMGTYVRFLGNYTPREGSVQLEGEPAPQSEGAKIGYFGMMRRVYRIEGWKGLYKGTMPTLVGTFVIVVLFAPVVAVLAAGHKILPDGRVYLPPTAAWLSTLISYALSVIPPLLFIPLEIFTNRAITTPHVLPAFSPSTALQTLLSPIEQAWPLRLYAAPGVAVATLLPALIVPSYNLLWHLIAPRLPSLFYTIPIGVHFVISGTIFLTPLHVMRTKLTLQRQGEAEPLPADGALPGDEVIAFRTEEAPYTGLVDCGRSVLREEGWKVLFRGWWITALGLGLPMIAAAIAPTEIDA